MRRSYLSAVLVGMVSATGNVAHAEPDLGEVVGTIARTVLEQQQAAHEQALWAGVVENGTAAAYRQYLNTYPEGPNARNARDQLARLDAVTTAESNAAQAEARLGLSQADRVAIQQRLAVLGHYQSGVDGALGPGSRRAISAWQQARDFEATGYLTAAQLPMLLNRVPAAPPAPTDGPDNSATSAAQAELNLGLTRSQRMQIQRDLMGLGYDTNGADGLFGSGTREAVRAWQRNTGQRATGYMTAAEISALRADAEARGTEATGDRAAAIDEDLLGLTRSERVALQQRLIALGYLTGQADGIFGSTTRRAISRWQGDNGLSETGYLGAEQVRTLQEQSRL